MFVLCSLFLLLFVLDAVVSMWCSRRCGVGAASGWRDDPGSEYGVMVAMVWLWV